MTCEEIKKRFPKRTIETVITAEALDFMMWHARQMLTEEDFADVRQGIESLLLSR